MKRRVKNPNVHGQKVWNLDPKSPIGSDGQKYLRSSYPESALELSRDMFGFLVTFGVFFIFICGLFIRSGAEKSASEDLLAGRWFIKAEFMLTWHFDFIRANRDD